MSQSIQLNSINTGSSLALKITPVMNYEFNTKYLKAYATNNALDENIVWEDITEVLLNKEDYYFKNKSKTNENGAISIKIELEYVDGVIINIETSDLFDYNNTEVIFDKDGVHSLNHYIIEKEFIINTTNSLTECEINLNKINEVI